MKHVELRGARPRMRLGGGVELIRVNFWLLASEPKVKSELLEVPRRLLGVDATLEMDCVEA